VVLNLFVYSKKESPNVTHDRVVYKFVENDYEKLQRVVELRLSESSKFEEYDMQKFEGEEELLEEIGYGKMQVIDTLLVLLWSAKPGGQDVGFQLKIKEFCKFNGIQHEAIGQSVKLFLPLLDASKETVAVFKAKIEEALQAFNS